MGASISRPEAAGLNLRRLLAEGGPRRKALVAASLFLIIVVAVVAALSLRGGPDEPAASDAAALPFWRTAPLDPDNVLAALATGRALDRSLDVGNPTHLTLDPSRGVLGLDYKAPPGLSETDLLVVASRTSFSALNILFANPGVQSVVIKVRIDVAGAAGETQDVTTVLLQRSTADGLDWRRLERDAAADARQVFCVADAMQIQAAIYDRIIDKGCLIGR